MVLIVLIVLWSIVLVPPAWQSHMEARRARQVDAFRRKLAVLAPAPDTPLARRPADAARPSEAARAHVAVMAGPNVVRLPVAEARETVDATGQLDESAAPAAESVQRGGRGWKLRVPRASFPVGRTSVLAGVRAVRVAGLAGAARAARAAKSAANRAAVPPARTRADVLRRRQQVLAGLAGATFATLLGAFVLGRPWAWAAHAVVVVLFAAYLAGLRRLRRLAIERRAKVRYLPAAATPVTAGERRRDAASR